MIDGQIPDCVPVVAWIDPGFLRGYLGRSDFDPIVETIGVSKAFGFDAIVRLVLEDVPAWETDEWKLETEVVQENGKRIRTKTIDTLGGRLREVTIAREIEPGRFFHHTTEHLVKTKDDLRLMERYQVVRPPVNTAPLARALACIGDDGVVVVYGGGAAHTGAALYLRGLERLTVDSMEEPAFYEGLLNWAIEYELDLLDTLQRFEPDLCQIGGLMAQGNFLGPEFYRRHVWDYDRRYIEQVHRRCNLFRMEAQPGSDFLGVTHSRITPMVFVFVVAHSTPPCPFAQVERALGVRNGSTPNV